MNLIQTCISSLVFTLLTTSAGLASFEREVHSIVVKDGSLYVARISGVYRTSFDNSITTLNPSDFSKVTSLPGCRGRNCSYGPGSERKHSMLTNSAHK